MKTALKTISIVAVVIGALAILGGVSDTYVDGYALVGGALYMAQGILALVYIGQQTKK